MEDFERTTDNNALELVFEQLGRQQFKFQLIITPFRLIGKIGKHIKTFLVQMSSSRWITLKIKWYDIFGSNKYYH